MHLLQDGTSIHATSRWFTRDRQGATEGYQPRRWTCCPTAIMSSSRPLVWTHPPTPPRLAASPCRLSLVPSSDHSRFTLITCDRCERVWRHCGECSAAWTSSSLVTLTGGLPGGHILRGWQRCQPKVQLAERRFFNRLSNHSWCLLETSDASYMVASAKSQAQAQAHHRCPNPGLGAAPPRMP